MIKLKELRGKKPQQLVAFDLGISQKTYSNYENGITEPSIPMLCKLADYFGVSLNYLCEYSPKYSQQDITDLEFKQLFENYKKLNTKNKSKLMEYTQGLLDGQ